VLINKTHVFTRCLIFYYTLTALLYHPDHCYNISQNSSTKTSGLLDRERPAMAMASVQEERRNKLRSERVGFGAATKLQRFLVLIFIAKQTCMQEPNLRDRGLDQGGMATSWRPE
jgi:hypothetical protein